MRDRGLAPTLAAILVICVGALTYLYKDSMPVTVRKMLTWDSGPAQVPQPEPAPKPVHKAKRKARAAENSPQPMLNLPVQVYEMVIELPPFPRAVDVKAGMTRDELIHKFGAPTLSATWTDVGSLNERYVYVQNGRLTTVVIRDGRVVSGRTDSVATKSP